MINQLDLVVLEEYKKIAAKLGLTLQEFMLFRVLQKLDNLSVITYSGDE